MKLFGLVGLLLAFSLITFIDLPKLNATANKIKYSAVYFTVVAVGIVIGVLEIFQIIPDYNKDLAFFYQKMTGIK